MNRRSLVLTLAWVLLTAPPVLLAQKNTQAAQQPQQQEQRPTLGPETAPERPTLSPSLGGPLTATTMNAAALRRVKTVYVGMMDNKLNLKLIDDFAKEGPFRVVSNRNDADAVLQGTCFDSAHLKEVHSEVFLTGKNGKAIWQDVIHQPFRPPPLPQAVSETANLIVTHLRQSILQPDH
ncbi:MAG: hypothetical protein ACRD2G_14680 [Terriglobia bacterium]